MARTRGTAAPTALKLLRGERAGRINHDEPQPEEGVPQCPSDDPEVRAVWDYTVKQLVQMRTLTMADRDPLYAYCEEVVQFRAVAAMVREDGAIVMTGRGPARHPGVAVMRESATMIKTLAQQFGLTPSARTAIKVADQSPGKAEDRPAARLLSS